MHFASNVAACIVMTNTTTVQEPKLGVPGAGLPFAELVIANIVFRWRISGKTRDNFVINFRNERSRIAALVRSCASASTRVLVPRLRGLEDSSRYWSVLMTLDHLRIVNLNIAGIIASLGKGVVPKTKVSTAAMKPKVDVTAAVITDYEASCDALLNTVAEIRNLKTQLRHVHPWFGQLDAERWFALAGGHMAIHRAQIESIIAGLSLPNNATGL